MVGTARFELATPCTPSKCATRLRYVPMESAVEDDSVGVDFQILHQSAEIPLIATCAMSGAPGNSSVTNGE